MVEQQERFFSVENAEQFQKRSQKLMEASRLGKTPDYENVEDIENQYGRFDVYKDTFAHLTNATTPRAEYDEERFEEEYYGSVIKKFVRNLGDDVIDKYSLMDHKGILNMNKKELGDKFKFADYNAKEAEIEDEKKDVDQRFSENRKDFRQANSESELDPTLFFHMPMTMPN